MSIKVKNCDGCNTKLRPDKRMDMGISSPGEPEVRYSLCYECAMKLLDGDKVLDARITAAGRKRHQSSGVLAA